jgi:hypothetical protein
MLDVPEISQHGFCRHGVAMSPKVPLQIADPQDQLGNRNRARVRLDAKQLMRIYRASETLKPQGFAEASEQVQDLTFEALQMLQRNIEKIAGTAGRI